MHVDYAIIGGGLAGLAAAQFIQKKTPSYLLFEATHRLGGRVGSDYKGGYTFDRGFQVLLPGYPTARSLLNYHALQFRYYPKAVTYLQGGHERWYGLPVQCPSGFDRAKKAALPLSDYYQLSLDLLNIFNSSSTTSTAQHLKRHYDTRTVSEYLAPFFQGVSLDPQLRLPVERFRYYLRMFFFHGAAVPRKGMQQLPDQLARRLPAQKHIRLNTPIQKIDGHTIVTASGDTFSAKHIILATPLEHTLQLLDHPDQSAPNLSLPVTTYYFATPSTHLRSPLIFLGNAQHIRHINIPSLISDEYAPKGMTLIMATQLSGTPLTDKALKDDLRRDLGDCVDDWNLIHRLVIPSAIPLATPHLKHPPHIHIAGDWRHTPSIEGALASGVQISKKL